MHNQHLGRALLVGGFFHYWVWVGEFATQVLSPYSHGHLGSSSAKDGAGLTQCAEPPFRQSELCPPDASSEGWAWIPTRVEISPVAQISSRPSLGCILQAWALVLPALPGSLSSRYASGQRKVALLFQGFTQPCAVLWELLSPPSLFSEEAMAMISWVYMVIIINSQCM